jgi:hypothetical protein
LHSPSEAGAYFCDDHDEHAIIDYEYPGIAVRTLRLVDKQTHPDSGWAPLDNRNATALLSSSVRSSVADVD